MPLISRLGVLIAYDPDTEADLIDCERQELLTNGAEIQKAIEEIIKQKNQEFHEQVERRLQSIETTFQEMIPDIQDDEKDEIRCITQEAFQKGIAGAPVDEIDLSEF